MTSTAIETGLEISVLEALDFEIVCQTVTIAVFDPDMPEVGHCDHAATHTAKIHSLKTCKWVDKFVCDECLTGFDNPCVECAVTPRIIEIAPLSGSL